VSGKPIGIGFPVLSSRDKHLAPWRSCGFMELNRQPQWSSSYAFGRFEQAPRVMMLDPLLEEGIGYSDLKRVAVPAQGEPNTLPEPEPESRFSQSLGDGRTQRLFHGAPCTIGGLWFRPLWGWSNVSRHGAHSRDALAPIATIARSLLATVGGRSIRPRAKLEDEPSNRMRRTPQGADAEARSTIKKVMHCGAGRVKSGDGEVA
jgi:hypothetical protein